MVVLAMTLTGFVINYRRAFIILPQVTLTYRPYEAIPS